MSNGRRADGRASVERRIGYSFRDPGLLAAALTHASSLPAGAVRAGEQLEFLGDAVLDLIVADRLLRRFPDLDEGRLSKGRALLVCERSLAAKARELGLGGVLRLGRGEELSGGSEKDSILAATYEAVIGAVFRAGGLARARALVERHFRSEIESGEPPGDRDWKTLLQERTQAELRTLPEYATIEERGPAHAREFEVEVRVAGRRLARGTGSSKRQAEQQAARAALDADAAREPGRGGRSASSRPKRA
jgi:ribonuclease-3